MPTIVPIDAVPAAMHEELLDAVFGDDRTTRTAYRIREGLERLVGLSFAALDDEERAILRELKDERDGQ